MYIYIYHTIMLLELAVIPHFIVGVFLNFKCEERLAFRLWLRRKFG